MSSPRSSMGPTSPRPTSTTLSPMPSSTSSTSSVSSFNFSKGHGAHSETGGLKKGKTEIRPSAVLSVNTQRAKSISGGSAKLKGGSLNWEFVPRTSDPTQFRAIATKTGGGSGSGSFTSFPVSPSQVPSSVLTHSGLKSSQIVDEPQSPRATRASSSSK